MTPWDKSVNEEYSRPWIQCWRISAFKVWVEEEGLMKRIENGKHVELCTGVVTKAKKEKLSRGE